MRRLLFGAATACALAAGPASAEPFTFVAIGDMPYRLPDDYGRFERLIAAINRAAPAFTVHVGDIKSGGTPCTDEAFQRIKDYFGTFEQPLVYTPGDNEWTDCHREKAGRFDPLERLAKVRSTFFAGPAQSLGRTALPLERQADLMPRHQGLVENQRWSREGVVFATVHMVGSNNGFERNEEMADEFFARDAANVAWIDDTFRKAAAAGAPAVVFAFQADPLFQVEPGGELAYANSGFKDALAALAKGAQSFGRPVLLIHGDAHAFIVDQPLEAADGEAVLENVYRLEVFGEDKVQAVRVLVDPDDPGVFGFRPLIVRENLETAKAG
jgi:hypothetical protein